MNYQNGKIYRLDCNITGEVYIGSTCQATVAKRMAQHVLGFKKWKKTGKGFVTSYQIIERGNYNITLIEAIQCNTKDELSAREGYFIRTMVCVNKNIAGRTKKECDKEYHQANREPRLEYMKEYSKDHYEANKAEIRAHHKEFRDANKDRINARRKELRAQKKNIIA